MIDWHHPRIYERFRCFGLCLFTVEGADICLLFDTLKSGAIEHAR